MKSKERNKMKKSLYLIRVLMILLGVGAFSQACTKLDEELFSEVTPSNFFKTDAEFVAALGSAYTQLGGYAMGDLRHVNTVTTDEGCYPTRGSDWDDGGTWRRLTLHAWGYEDGFMAGPWDFCYGGVSTANRLIYQFKTLSDGGQVNKDVAAAYIGELTTLRGFFYWWLIDMYGNVPYDNDFANASSAPPTVARATVYSNVVTDLEAAVPLLTKNVDGTTYGRMNYWAGKFLLAKLYLNAQVYSGTAQWDKVIAACDEIINSGKYSLESNYFANFNVNNSGSKEFIFAIPYDQIFFTGFNLNMQTLHYGSQQTFNLTSQPWNGFCTLESFYKSYDPTDLRRGDIGTLTTPATKRGNFLAGYQFKNGGGLVMDDGADGADPDGKPLNFGNMGDLIGGQPAPQINELGPQAWRQSGVRNGKWEYQIGGTPDMSNDFSVFRYADVLLMKAEAVWRKSASATDATALALMNQIRSRAGLNNATTLDGKLSFDLAGPVVAGGELFNERGREMFDEHFRRQDMIRFGFWSMNAKWTIPYHNVGDVIKSDSYLSLFPINKSKLAANPNLVQNTGYPAK
ncbi:MAG: RagB/SusD family nutrient uptake outer membrane protein [Bacteroidetes bacterium]|nr:MAG: RagB/SusD family nutrient uptake outer membrane protein [Bacteroidota bacterium]